MLIACNNLADRISRAVSKFTAIHATAFPLNTSHDSHESRTGTINLRITKENARKTSHGNAKFNAGEEFDHQHVFVRYVFEVCVGEMVRLYSVDACFLKNRTPKVLFMVSGQSVQ